MAAIEPMIAAALEYAAGGAEDGAVEDASVSDRCRDCAHQSRCEFLLGVSFDPLSTSCDWIPSRFFPITNELISEEPEEFVLHEGLGGEE
jgi:hypothetical protein